MKYSLAIQPEPPCCILRGIPRHPQPEPFIGQQVEEPLKHRGGIPHRLCSEVPPTALATTGVPKARVSRTVFGKVSAPGEVEIEVGNLVVPGDHLGVLLVGDEPDLNITEPFQ